MNALFDTDVPVELAPADVVRALVDRYGYAGDKVRAWTRAKAETVLASCRRQRHRDLNHGAAGAAAQEPDAPCGPTGRELGGRLEAAVCLEQAVATNDADELLLSLTHAMYPLVQDELRAFAGLVALQLRVHPVTGDPLVPAADPN